MNKLELQGFGDAVKEAAPLGALSRAGRYLTEGAGRTALIGAGAGAATGAATADPENRLQGALHGAIGGAALGGAVGGAGRFYRDAKLMNQGVAQRAGQGLARFGRRQLHGLTGAYSKNPAAMGMGSGAAEERVALLKKRLADAKKYAPGSAAKLDATHAAEVKGVTEHGKREQGWIDSGITSLPGVVKGLAGKNRGHVARKLWEANTGGGAGGLKGWDRTKALGRSGALVGLPVVMSAADLAKGDESSRGGLNVKQKLVRAGTSVGGGALTAGMPLVSQMVAGGAIDAAGQKMVRPHANTRDIVRSVTEPVQIAGKYIPRNVAQGQPQ